MFGPARIRAQRVDVAFGVGASVRLGQETFVVAEPAAANAFVRRVGLKRPARPAEGLGIFLGDEVVR